MKKLVCLFSMLTIVLVAVTACEKNESNNKHAATATPVAELTGTPTAQPTVTVTPTAVPTPTEFPIITVTPKPEYTFPEELVAKYDAHVDDAKAYLTKLINAKYAYKQSIYLRPDQAFLSEEKYYNEEDICIKRTVYNENSDSRHTDFYDRKTVERGEYQSDIQNGYVLAASFYPSRNTYAITYHDCVYDESGRVTEHGEYRYEFSPDAAGNLTQVPYSDYDKIAYYRYTYKTDAQGNTVRSAENDHYFEFNSKGKLLSAYSLDDDGQISFLAEEYKYDTAGRLIYFYSQAEGGYSKVWTYDKNDLLVSYEYASDGQSELTKYSYDSKGMITGATGTYCWDYGQAYRTITESEYYGSEGDGFGKFAGKLLKETSSTYFFDETTVKYSDTPSEVSCKYYSYTTYEQDMNQSTSDPVTSTEPKAGEATIDNAHFPDLFFKEYVGHYIDKDGNGVLSKSEMEQVTEIDCTNCMISSLTGLDYFVNLEILHCGDNPKLTVLDVSKLTNLRVLDCHGDSLTRLEVSNLTKLQELDCRDNYLTALDVSNLTKLCILRCSGVCNAIPKLDVRNLTELQILECSNNPISVLSVENLTKLRELRCEFSGIKELRLNKLTGLQVLYCGSNELTNLDVTALTNLQILSCDNNALSALDIRKLQKLETLNCSTNKLTSLNVNNLTNLKALNCSFNQLINLNVSKLTNLLVLQCDNNRLVNLDVSTLTSLQELHCDFNQLTNLTVNNLTDLKYLNCYSNPLKTIDISKLLNLKDFACDDNVTILK